MVLFSSCNGMAHNASLFVEYFESIVFYVWEDVPEGGLLSDLYFVSILEQQYSRCRFYLAFSNTLGFYSACLPFRFF